MENQSNTQYIITVNGKKITVNHAKLIAADILTLAAQAGAFPHKPEEYILASDDPKHEFKSDEWVDFHEYKDFHAERSAPTPIAGVLQG